jgi:hypothetical protein
MNNTIRNGLLALCAVSTMVGCYSTAYVPARPYYGGYYRGYYRPGYYAAPVYVAPARPVYAAPVYAAPVYGGGVVVH